MVNLACSVAHKIKYNCSTEAADLWYPRNPILLQMHMQHFCDDCIIIPCCLCVAACRFPLLHWYSCFQLSEVSKKMINRVRMERGLLLHLRLTLQFQPYCSVQTTVFADIVCPSASKLVSVTKRSVRYSWNSVQDFFTKR